MTLHMIVRGKPVCGKRTNFARSPIPISAESVTCKSCRGTLFYKLWKWQTNKLAIGNSLGYPKDSVHESRDFIL